MSGGPYIYDPELKKFVMRPSAEPVREPVEEVADEPPTLAKPPPRDRRKLVLWLVSTSLFLIWLILLVVWTRQITPVTHAPVILLKPAPEELSRKELLR